MGRSLRVRSSKLCAFPLLRGDSAGPGTGPALASEAASLTRALTVGPRYFPE